MRYSPMVMDHFYHPRCVGKFDQQESNVGMGVIGSLRNGDILEIYIKVLDEVIVDARFKAYGSCPTIAVGSYIAEWLINKSLSEASLLRSHFIAEVLELPPVKLHCALLGEDAVKAAIEDYASRDYNRTFW